MKRRTVGVSLVVIAILCVVALGFQPQQSKSGLVAPDGQDTADLKEVKLEDLQKEVRARELRSATIDFSDLVLESHAEQRNLQPGFKNLKLNPQLAKYSFLDLVSTLIDEQKSIYGQDNRKDLYLVSSDPLVTKSADAVVSLFDETRIIPLEDGTTKIVNKIYGTEYRLCEKEPFFRQPCSAFCSGVLVAPDIVATAGHCIDTQSTGTPPLVDIRFVFGYRMRDKDNAELVVSSNEVYRGKEIIQRVYTAGGADWALVRLNRTVTGHSPVPIRRGSKVSNAEDVYVIGHPRGLPAKFADGAIVRENSNADFFVANLDTYGGNSGSPVFNRKTHEVEGILVRGETDFVSQSLIGSSSCQVSLRCPNNGCRGEDCVRTTLFASLVPQH